MNIGRLLAHRAIRNTGLKRLALAACRAEDGSLSPLVATIDPPPMLRWDLNERLGSIFHIRNFRITTHLASTVNVEVGSFGESITEGSIATISKQAGDTVAEDEVLFQIETDKVTIDVRAPQSGKLESILVKEEDTVTVGQVVAKIAVGSADAEEGENKAGSATGPSSDQAEALEKESPVSAGEAAEAAKQASSVSGDVSADTGAKAEPPPHRQPAIKFPRRRTPDGVAISSLTAEEQKKYLKATEAPQPQAQAQAKKQPAPTLFSTGPWYAGRERGTKLSQSRVLTEREMEMIELGGA